MKNKKHFKVTANKAVARNKKIMASYNDPYTENLADFGYAEYEELKELLVAWFDGIGLPDDFYADGVRPAFNKDSGYVFLVNSDYQVAMINPNTGNLECWYNTPYSGHEGFYADLLYTADESWDVEDLEYVRDLAEYNEDTQAIDKLNALIAEVEGEE